MKKNEKYTTDGKCAVYLGKTMVAQSYVGYDGYEVRVLQGMPRMEVINKIATDCPEFLAANDWDTNKVPKLFSNNKTKSK